MISSPDLAMTFLFDMLWRWSLYLNRCVAASALECLDAQGCQVPLSLEPILAELEGGLIRQADPFSGSWRPRLQGQRERWRRRQKHRRLQRRQLRRWRGRHRHNTKILFHWGGCGGGGALRFTPAPSWWGRSSRPCTVQFFARTGTCAGLAGGTASGNAHTSPPPPEVATTVAGLLKASWGG